MKKLICMVLVGVMSVGALAGFKMESQSLGLEKVENARQIGGYQTADGRHVREDVLLRSGKLSGATEEDLKILTEKYNLKQVVDFRTSGEVSSEPDPDIEGVTNTNVRVLDESSDTGKSAANAMTGIYQDDPAAAMISMVENGMVDEDMYVDVAMDEQGVEIISTGGTKHALDQAGIKTLSIEEVTGFPEMMDGRVKTLHPKIHGGLLGRRDLPSHMEAMETENIQPIDFVCVNLYPFKETIMKPDVEIAEAIENIDIGGPSMLRSAAKNHEFVTSVVDPSDYEEVLSELRQYGHTSLSFRQKLAAKVFRHTAAYDALIAQYLTDWVEEKEPEKLTLTYERKQTLRYGENSHQAAAFYQSALLEKYSIAAAKQLHGKELSYNNIRDADAALRIMKEYDEPTVVALKHMNPCGIGTASTIDRKSVV